eukprot:585436-Hanusia_phi.AAC.2
MSSVKVSRSQLLPILLLTAFADESDDEEESSNKVPLSPAHLVDSRSPVRSSYEQMKGQRVMLNKETGKLERGPTVRGARSFKAPHVDGG